MVFLRRATENDLTLMMAWRSNPLVYQGFYSQTAPLIWDEHIRFWQSRNKDWRTFIVMLKEDDFLREIGVVNIGQLDHWSPEIGYYIGEITLWGKGYGEKAVSLAIEWLKEYGKEYAHTTILDDNVRSIRLITSLGFTYLGKAREGESWYQKLL